MIASNADAKVVIDCRSVSNDCKTGHEEGDRQCALKYLVGWAKYKDYNLIAFELRLLS